MPFHKSVTILFCLYLVQFTKKVKYLQEYRLQKQILSYAHLEKLIYLKMICIYYKHLSHAYSPITRCFEMCIEQLYTRAESQHQHHHYHLLAQVTERDCLFRIREVYRQP